MAWQTLNPYLAGGVQPLSGTLTVISTIDNDKNIFGTVFVANVGEEIDRVRVALRPAGTVTVSDEQYVLYDTEVQPNYMLQLSNIALNGLDSLIGYSEKGLAVFNLTGDEIKNYT